MRGRKGWAFLDFVTTNAEQGQALLGCYTEDEQHALELRAREAFSHVIEMAGTIADLKAKLALKKRDPTEKRPRSGPGGYNV